MTQERKKRFVHLSSASRSKVWDWSEKNRGHPLAEAYGAACVAVGTIVVYSVRVNDVFGDDIKDMSVMLRDAIGRKILKEIKREYGK